MLSLPPAQAYLRRRFRHLIVDNVEEDNPASHGFLESLLPACDSALLIYDRDAGFRRFLGADPDHARRLRQFCQIHESLGESQVMSPTVEALGAKLAAQLGLVESSDDDIESRARR